MFQSIYLKFSFWFLFYILSDKNEINRLLKCFFLKKTLPNATFFIPQQVRLNICYEPDTAVSTEAKSNQYVYHSKEFLINKLYNWLSHLYTIPKQGQIHKDYLQFKTREKLEDKSVYDTDQYTDKIILDINEEGLSDQDDCLFTPDLEFLVKFTSTFFF